MVRGRGPASVVRLRWLISDKVSHDRGKGKEIDRARMIRWTRNVCWAAAINCKAVLVTLGGTWGDHSTAVSNSSGLSVRRDGPKIGSHGSTTKIKAVELLHAAELESAPEDVVGLVHQSLGARHSEGRCGATGSEGTGERKRREAGRWI